MSGVRVGLGAGLIIEFESVRDGLIIALTLSHWVMSHESCYSDTPCCVHDAPKDISPKCAGDVAGVVAQDIADIEAKLQGLINELLRLSEEEWDLKLNLAKIRVMVFGNKQTGPVSKLKRLWNLSIWG